MSKYTITIKNLIDNKFDFQMNSYPIFDENYREILNNKILNHYYEDEIGFETATLFKFYLNNKLNEIMPYYNTLYENQLKLINNLTDNVNLKEELSRVNNTKTETNSNSKSTNNGVQDSKSIFQNTPQGKIYQGNVDELNWATNATTDRNTTNNTIDDISNGNGKSDTTERYIKTITGNNGNKYNIEILKDIKDNILNIDMMIINDLEELFMGLM